MLKPQSTRAAPYYSMSVGRNDVCPKGWSRSASTEEKKEEKKLKKHTRTLNNVQTSFVIIAVTGMKKKRNEKDTKQKTKTTTKRWVGWAVGE